MRAGRRIQLAGDENPVSGFSSVAVLHSGIDRRRPFPDVGIPEESRALLRVLPIDSEYHHRALRGTVCSVSKRMDRRSLECFSGSFYLRAELFPVPMAGTVSEPLRDYPLVHVPYKPPDGLRRGAPLV